MRLIDADELIEHAWRDKLDSRELIAEMIEKAPTIKEIPTKIPINVFEQLISLEPKTGRWIRFKEFENGYYHIKCSECGQYWSIDGHAKIFRYCFNCGAKMEEVEE
jgi:ribosomal protein S27E